MLRAHLVPDVEAPPNLSLCVGDDDGAVREFHRLFRAGAAGGVRTRSKGRLLRATLVYLDAFADDPTGTARLGGHLLVRGGDAVVVAPGFPLDRVERRLERLGYRVAGVPGVPLDPDALEVILWSPRLAVDTDAWAALDREFPSREPELPLRSVRLPLRRAVVGRTDLETWSDARTLVELTWLVAPSGRFGEADLALARCLLEQVDVRACGGDDGALLAALRDDPS